MPLLYRAQIVCLVVHERIVRLLVHEKIDRLGGYWSEQVAERDTDSRAD